MPWTFAHPAAVLPIRRVAALMRLPLLGLVLGSIAPDLPYYVGRYDVATLAHSAIGALLVCVPLSALLAVMVVRWRAVLTAPLPHPHRGAIDGLRAPDTASVRGLIALGAAAFVGALTHIAWDSFTHASGEAVRALPLLRTELGTVGGRTVHLYGVLQHASTILGLLVLVVAYRRWLHAAPVATAVESSRSRVARLIGCMLGSVALGLGAALLAAPAVPSVSGMVVRSVIYATGIFAVAYLALSIHLLRADAV